MSYYEYPYKLTWSEKFKHIGIGCLTGMIGTVIIVYLLFNFLPEEFLDYINILPKYGNYGILLSLGSISHIFLFLFFLWKNIEYKALGVAISTVLMTFGLMYFY